MPQTGGTRSLLSVSGADKARCPAGFMHGQSVSFPHPSLNLVSEMNHKDHLVLNLTEQPGHCLAVLHKYSVIPFCPQPGALLQVSLASTLEGRVPNPSLVLQGAIPHLQIMFILQHL